MDVNLALSQRFTVEIKNGRYCRLYGYSGPSDLSLVLVIQELHSWSMDSLFNVAVPVGDRQGTFVNSLGMAPPLPLLPHHFPRPHLHRLPTFHRRCDEVRQLRPSRLRSNTAVAHCPGHFDPVLLSLLFGPQCVPPYILLQLTMHSRSHCNAAGKMIGQRRPSWLAA